MSNNENSASVILAHVSDQNSKGKPGQAVNRRRASQIVHDEKGNARVEWIDAGYAGVPLERAPLSIEQTPSRADIGRLAIERNRSSGFDPYGRPGAHGAASKKPPAKRDLRKLGEWIKLKRELDARKTSEDPESE